MTEETLIIANEIKTDIDELQYEVKKLPRKLVSSIESKYSKRILKIEYKLKFLGDVFKDYFEMELTDEDLKALVKIREDKIKKLQKELAELH